MKSFLISIKTLVLLCLVTFGILIPTTFMNSRYKDSERSADFRGHGGADPMPTEPSEKSDRNYTAMDIPDVTYEKTKELLKMLGDSGRLHDLIKEEEQIESKWGPTGGENYGLLYLRLIAALETENILKENPGARDRIQEYAVTALKRADFFALDTERHLLGKLRYLSDRDPPLVGPGIERRRERVGLWLHALRRIERETDPSFDPNDLFVMNVRPPAGANIPSGASPSAIKDPEMRAEYERLIEENIKKAEYYNRQHRLRLNGPSIISNGVKYISKMYAKSPSDLEDLRNLLISYDISKGLQERIMLETERATILSSMTP